MTDAKPEPIAEIVITPSFKGSSVLNILAATPDADQWVRGNAEEFGTLFYPEDSKHWNSFSLHVDNNYDTHEVTEYIRTMGGGDKGSAVDKGLAVLDSLANTDDQAMREVEMILCPSDNTWYTHIVKIPANTPGDQIEAVARDIAADGYGGDVELAYVGVYWLEQVQEQK